MAESNPFESMKNSADSDLMSENALLYLAQTRPWLLFMSILMFLGAGLMVMGGLSMMLLGGLGGSGGPPELAMMGPALGLIYILLAAFYAVPAALLMQQALAIGAVQAGGGADALATVLRHHRNFWRVVGGFTLLLMVLYCGGFVVMMTMIGSMANL